ncbi:MAG: trypsin-like peptidase domain-containing protein, partial [Hyphomicrobium sp.]
MAVGSVLASSVNANPLQVSKDETSLAPMLAKVLPAVVAIRVRGEVPAEQSTLRDHPIFGQIYRNESAQGQAQPFISNGSGVIVDAAEGLVVTNFHVIESAREIKVKLHDGRQFDGILVGKDPAIDIAVVRIKPERLTAVPTGDSIKVRVGDLVVAIGNP